MCECTFLKEVTCRCNLELLFAAFWWHGRQRSTLMATASPQQLVHPAKVRKRELAIAIAV
jgi:hypothetical protein